MKYFSQQGPIFFFPRDQSQNISIKYGDGSDLMLHRFICVCVHVHMCAVDLAETSGEMRVFRPLQATFISGTNCMFVLLCLSVWLNIALPSDGFDSLMKTMIDLHGFWQVSDCQDVS